MIKRMFRKIGIVLTDRQTMLIKLALWSVVAMLLMNILAYTQIANHTVGSLKCESATNYSGIFIGRGESHCSAYTSLNAPAWFLLLEGLLFASAILPILLYALTYFGKLIFSRRFRETEMEHSVEYLESDEREQLLTMKATRRSYMILNFALLVGWLISLFVGDIHLAFWLFVIQIIGALSFRHQLDPH